MSDDDRSTDSEYEEPASESGSDADTDASSDASAESDADDPPALEVLNSGAPRLDLDFQLASIKAYRRELRGVALELRILCEQYGYTPTNEADLLHLFSEPGIAVMRRNLSAGFTKRTNKPLTQVTCFKFIVCMLVSGSYREAYSNLAKDAETYADAGNAFLRFSAEMPADEFQALAAEIDDRYVPDGASRPRPGSADVFLDEFRAAILAGFARLVSYVARESEPRLLVGFDDLQSKGKKAHAAGMTSTYNRAKATKLGVSCFTSLTVLLRVPLTFTYRTLDDKERGVKLAGKFAEELGDVLRALNIPWSAVWGDFDRGSTAMMTALAARGGFYTSTIQKRRACFTVVPRADSEAPATHNPEKRLLVSLAGGSTSYFVKPKPGVTQVAQRVKDRLTFLETNIPSLQGVVLNVLKAPVRTPPPIQDAANSALVADMLNNVVELVQEQRTPLWREMRKFIITSTVVLLLLRLDDAWMLNAELSGEEYHGVCGSALPPDPRVARGSVRFDTDANGETFPRLHPESLASLRRHFTLLRRLRLVSDVSLPATLQAVAGDAVNDATAPTLIKALRTLGVKQDALPALRNATALPEARVSELREQVVEERDGFGIRHALSALVEQNERSFPSTRAMRAGIELEPVVRASIASFVDEHGGGARVWSYDAEGLYESKASPYLATSPDGFAVVELGGRRSAAAIEIKSLEDEDLIRRVKTCPKFSVVNIVPNMTNAQVGAIKDAIPEHLDHIPQLVQHSAVLKAECVVYVTADSRAGGAILRVVIVFVHAHVRRAHVDAFDVLGKMYVPWLLDDACDVPFPDNVDEGAVRASLARRRVLRESAPYGAGSDGGKSGVTSAHNRGKTAADALHQQMIDARYDTAKRGPKFNIFTDLVTLLGVTTIRLHAAHQVVRAKGGFNPAFDETSLGSVRKMRRAVNDAVGDTPRRIRQLARDLEIEMYTETRQVTTPIAAPAITAATADPHWQPHLPAFMQMVAQLRDSANRGTSKVRHWSENPYLVKWRTHSSAEHGHNHEKVKLERRLKCILDCWSCPSSEPHTRNHVSASYMCARCGVPLSCEVRDAFGGRSAWDVFHGQVELPEHPYAGVGSQGAAAAPPTAPGTVAAGHGSGAGLDASAPTDSAKATRKRARAETAGIVPVNLSVTFGAGTAAV